MIDICDFAVGLQPPTARLDHRQRTARPQDDGAMAPARTDGRDHRIQLPSRRLELECSVGGCVRQSGDLEAERPTPLTAIATAALFDQAAASVALPHTSARS